MKIIRTTFVCPKCKKEYINSTLMSYWGGMAEAARDFVENNENTVICEKCGVRLVEDENLEFYNKKGDFAYKSQVLKFPQGEIFQFYLNMVELLQRIIQCFNSPEILIEGVLEKVRKENIDGEKLKKNKTKSNILLNHIKISVKEEKEHQVYDLILGEYEYSEFGDRYNSFVIEYNMGLLKSIVEFFVGALKKDLQLEVQSSIKANLNKKLMTYFV